MYTYVNILYNCDTNTVVYMYDTLQIPIQSLIYKILCTIFKAFMYNDIS